MAGPRTIVSPWENGPTRYRVMGGANPNGIEWEIMLPIGASETEHKNARADMERVYSKLMETEPKGKC